MLSIIFCSRLKDNPASALPRLLDSAVEHIAPRERDRVEFLIKYDDDDERPPESWFAKYPFRIRTFCWSRGEGRHALHHAQEYLFAQRDPRSRFCLMTADDFHFTRSGFVSEILSIRDEFCILCYRRPDIEAYANAGYERPELIREWAVSFGEWSPVITGRLIEVCQNFGWQSNVDSWLMALSLALYDLYKVVIWKKHEPFYERTGGYGPGDTPTYNNMELTGKIGPDNRYWFELVRRQARNLYLNMEHGTDLRKLAWTGAPRRLWRKVWAEPLLRLPTRVYRKVRRGVGALLS